MKKKKLSLDALKVKSFVTSFDSKSENTIRGGERDATILVCPNGGKTFDYYCRYTKH